MKIKNLNQTGSHVVSVVLALVVIAVVSFAGWRVMSSSKKESTTTKNTNSQPVSNNQSQTQTAISWSHDDKGWKANGTPPACPNPLTIISPTNISQDRAIDIPYATAILYPGQYRGSNYKPHGGFGFEKNLNDLITVKLPMDSKLYKGSRYIEQGETQYLLVFINSCGLMFKFDHLYTLTSTYQKIVEENFPEAKVDDSRTTNLTKNVEGKAGDTIATGVGFKKTGNTTFDFGVYDLRNKNDISKNSTWAAKHSDDNEYAPYAICWLDILPAKDAAAAKALPGGDGVMGKTSDYCKS